MSFLVAAWLLVQKWQNQAVAELNQAVRGKEYRFFINGM